MCQCGNCDEVTLFSGSDGVGIVSITDNGDGTFTILMSDGTTWTSGDLTGPQGPQGPQGAPAPQPLTKVKKTDYVFTINGNYTHTVQSNVYSIEVQLIGAGGGTGAIFNTVYAGGGSGAYIKATLTVTPGQALPFTVGQGAIATWAANGTDTTFTLPSGNLIAGAGTGPIVSPGEAPYTVTPGWGGAPIIPAGVTNFIAAYGNNGEVNITATNGLKVAKGGVTPILDGVQRQSNTLYYPENTANVILDYSSWPSVGSIAPFSAGLGGSRYVNNQARGGVNGAVIITEYSLY